MKMQISKLPFITFLKKHQVYLLHCICDLLLYKFENNPRNQAPNREYCTVRHATLIRSKRSATEIIKKKVIFLVRTTFSRYEKIPVPCSSN